VEQKGYLRDILYSTANVALLPQCKFGGLGHKYKSGNIAFRFFFLAETSLFQFSRGLVGLCRLQLPCHYNGNFISLGNTRQTEKKIRI